MTLTHLQSLTTHLQALIEAHGRTITKSLLQERECWLRHKQAQLGFAGRDAEFAAAFELEISPPEMTHLHNNVWKFSENLRLVRR